MSLARQTRNHVLAIIASAPQPEGGLTPADIVPEAAAYTRAVDVAAAQIRLRLTHDLRRLSEIKAVANKIAAKREMLPEYRAWVAGVLAAGEATAGRDLAPTGADEVLPTVMVWAIDTADWRYALDLAAHVIRFGVALPARYQRDAPTLVLELIADAALKAQLADERFPLDVLEEVEMLVDGVDMHDEPRAKLEKALGIELTARAADAEPHAARPMIDAALARFAAAQALDARIGVRTAIRGLEKARAALPPAEPDTPGQSSNQPG